MQWPLSAAETFGVVVGLVGVLLFYLSYRLARYRSKLRADVNQAVQAVVSVSAQVMAATEEEGEELTQQAVEKIQENLDKLREVFEAFPPEDRLPVAYAGFGAGAIVLGAVIAGFLQLTGG